MTLLELETGGTWGAPHLEEECQPGSRGAGGGAGWAVAAESPQCGLAGWRGCRWSGGLGGAMLGVILKGLRLCFIMCCVLFGRLILLMSLPGCG